MSMQKCKIIRTSSVSQLEVHINVWIEEGNIPYGGADKPGKCRFIHNISYSTDGIMHIAIIIYEDEEIYYANN